MLHILTSHSADNLKWIISLASCMKVLPSLNRNMYNKFPKKVEQ